MVDLQSKFRPSCVSLSNMGDQIINIHLLVVLYALYLHVNDSCGFGFTYIMIK